MDPGIRMKQQRIGPNVTQDDDVVCRESFFRVRKFAASQVTRKVLNAIPPAVTAASRYITPVS